MAESDQIVITFRLRAALEYVEPPPDPIHLFTRFDDRFGHELPGHVWNTVPDPIANRYDSRWRTIFYSEAEALTFLAALTGSAAVAALAASVMREFAPPRTNVTTRIYDVRKDGSEIESVQATQTGVERIEISTPAMSKSRTSRNVDMPFRWWILGSGLLFALVWSIWTAWVATWFEHQTERSPQQPIAVDISIDLIQRPPTLPQQQSQPQLRRTWREERACPDCPVIMRIRP